MTHRILLLLLAALLTLTVALPARAQDDEKPRLTFGGFIKVDAFRDSRQVVAARDGLFLLYPKPADRYLPAGATRPVDRNAGGNLNIGALYTRAHVGIAVPSVLGATTTGLIEADFLGTTNGLENTLRLRHAFVNLAWERVSVRAGQYWSPLWVPEMLPQTASFNLGAPFARLARFPQLRVTLTPGAIRLIGAVSAQRDGFEEISGRLGQQQSGVPALHAHVERPGERVFAGVGVHLRTVRPDLGGRTFTSGAVTGYVRYQGPSWALRTQGLLGSDMADHLMLGGYAETVRTGETAYRPLRTASVWTNANTTRPGINVGLFAGYSTNLGAAAPLADGETIVATHARGADIAYLWRLAPVVFYDAGRVRLALELEATRAQYAPALDEALRPVADDADPVTNVRTLFTVFLFF